MSYQKSIFRKNILKPTSEIFIPLMIENINMETPSLIGLYGNVFSNAKCGLIPDKRVL